VTTMIVTPPTPEFLTAAEAAKYSRLSYSTLKRLTRKGTEVGLRKLGRRVVFEVATLRRYLTTAGASPPTNSL
jgi:hypothetical protein